MKEKLIKLAVILGIIMINLFSCLFSQIVSAASVSGLTNQQLSDKLNDDISSDTPDYLQYGAAGKKNAFFDFDAEGMVDQGDKINIYSGNFSNYDVNKKSVICVSPGVHTTATSQRIECIMDVTTESVIVYSKVKGANKVTVTETSFATKDDDLKKAVKYAKMFVYFASKSIDVADAKNDGKTEVLIPENSESYKCLMRFQLFGGKFDYFKKLGVPEKLSPKTEKNYNPAKEYYKKKVKEYNNAIKSKQYVGRVVFLNGYTGDADSGQNDCIFSGKAVDNAKLKVYKTDNSGNPLKGAKFKVYEVVKNKKGKEVRGKEIASGRTNAKGGFTVSGVAIGKKYEVEEVKAPSGYAISSTTKRIKIKAGNNNSLTFTNDKLYTLNIKKTSPTGGALAGAEFKVYNATNDNQKTGNAIVTKTTDSTGLIACTLTEGKKYYIEETKAPSGYDLSSPNYQVVYLDSDKTVTFSNPYAKTNLKIKKIDKDTRKALAGVKFKVEFTEPRLVATEKDKYVSIASNPGTGSYTTTETELVTDANGEIQINGIYEGKYKITEVYNPNKGYAEYPNVERTIDVQKNASNLTTFTLENERIYIDLSGRVWEDKLWYDGKEPHQNGLLSNTEEEKGDVNDKLLANVTVRLKDKDGNVIKEVQTDGNGAYIIKDVLINKLEEYYVEFNYNGMCYESVAASIDKGKVGNKAIEGDARPTFNNGYAAIEPGKAVGQDGTDTHTLKYDTEDYFSKIHYGDDLKYGYEGQKYPINGMYNDVFGITATTYNAYNGYLSKIKTPDEIRKEEITELTDINLGVTEREQPELHVVKDVDKVRVSINGATHIYKYEDRRKTELWTEDPMNMSPTVRYASGSEYGNYTYSRALYPSDVYYSDPVGETDENGVKVNELRVKVTYKMTIQNASEVKTILNKLDDYYDLRFYNKKEQVKIGTDIETEGEEAGNIKPGTELAFDMIENANDSYNKLQIKDINMELGDYEQKPIYVQFEVKQDEIENIVEFNNNRTSDEQIKLENIAEVASYSCKDENGNPYAGIDKNSQPGNVDPSKKTTFEYDTDKSPGLKLVLNDQRKTDGKVFIDNPLTDGNFKTEEVNTGKERKGNGKYDDGETGVEGVTVELYNTRTNAIAQLYNQETKEWKPATTQTNGNGDFSFEGFIPDNYKIIYKWGGQTYKDTKGNDQKIRVQDYKSTIYQDKEGVEWYKVSEPDPRYSDATDDYTRRQEIDAQTRLITNANKEVIKNYSGEIELEDGNKAPLITDMSSPTQEFRVNLEYTTEITDKTVPFENHIQNMDFGIIERAKQALKLTKRVSRTRLVLANGNTVIDATYDGNGNITSQDTKYTTYIPKTANKNATIKMEIDNEILQSARLEIEYQLKVENISEKEYLTQNYYKYGEPAGVNDLVALNANQVIDYVDNNLALNLDNLGGWNAYTAAEKPDLIGKGLLANELQPILAQTNTIINTDQFKGNLRPEGDTTRDMTLNLYRILPSVMQDEDSTLDNDTEIIKIIKTGGSTLTTTPGNYVPTDSPKEVDEAEAETVTIVPPTGLTVNYIAYTLLAISSLGILVSGIILIKKFALK